MPVICGFFQFILPGKQGRCTRHKSVEGMHKLLPWPNETMAKRVEYVLTNLIVLLVHICTTKFILKVTFCLPLETDYFFCIICRIKLETGSAREISCQDICSSNTETHSKIFSFRILQMSFLMDNSLVWAAI